MSKTNDQTAQMLSRAIFDCSLEVLSIEQRIFVHHHIKEYQKYRNDFAKLALSAMVVTKLKGDDYYIIWDLYTRRISFDIVIEGCADTIRTIRQNNKKVTTIAYFKPSILRTFESYISKNTFMNTLSGMLPDDGKWLWLSYQAWKNDPKAWGRYFDLFEGWNDVGKGLDSQGGQFES